MICPKCGNSELQQHHRFCCQCGYLLDGRSASSATSLSETSPQKIVPDHELTTPSTGQLSIFFLSFILSFTLVLGKFKVQPLPRCLCDVPNCFWHAINKGLNEKFASLHKK